MRKQQSHCKDGSPQSRGSNTLHSDKISNHQQSLNQMQVIEAIAHGPREASNHDKIKNLRWLHKNSHNSLKRANKVTSQIAIITYIKIMKVENQSSLLLNLGGHLLAKPNNSHYSNRRSSQLLRKMRLMPPQIIAKNPTSQRIKVQSTCRKPLQTINITPNEHCRSILCARV